MTKREVLEDSTFGKRVAEEEVDLLEKYFVQTEQWRRLLGGEVDIVYGPKGSGKSALYSLLTQEFEKLRVQRRIVSIPAENPRGTPAFRDLVDDPPATEDEFRSLWKFYFLSLLANYVRHHMETANQKQTEAQQVIDILVDAGLLLETRSPSLKSMLKAALDFVRSRTISVESGLKIDPISGAPEVTAKLAFGEPTMEQRKLGFISPEDAFEKLMIGLKYFKITVWLMLDRLDVAFTENSLLEKNALRALFRVYLDLLAYESLAIKIFLRDDIWDRLVADGFREASHITRSMTIVWDQKSLLNLIVRRALFNTAIVNYYAADPQEILSDTSKQESFFYQVFPDQIAIGRRQTSTLDWMLTRVADGSQHPAPRELIHLLQLARDTQLRAYEIGGPEPIGLIGRLAIKDSLPEVSKVRFEKTLCAEYPRLKKYLMKLENKKAAQSLQSLTHLFELSTEVAVTVVEELVQAGFFVKKMEKGSTVYWVPFLYRDALHLVQGAAEK
jgi:hypothetical protein